MKRKMILYPGALLLALALALQGVGLVWMDRPAPLALFQCLLVSLALAVATHEVWRNRLRLDHRVDMFLVMLAFGGLGMLAGTALDQRGVRSAECGVRSAECGNSKSKGQPSAQLALTAPACCPIMVTMAPMPPIAHAGTVWDGFGRSLMSWMTALMLLGGIPPTWLMTRCAVLAGRSRRRWIATHLAGNLGMVLGMIAAGRTLGHPLGLRLGAMETGHHLAMVAGMLLGMVAFQFLAEAALGLRPWRRVELPPSPNP